MPVQPVTMRRRGHDGQVTEWQEGGGGVFHPLPEHGLATPVWTYGPPKAERFLFSCPVSSLSEDVRDLFRLWHACQATKTLPLAGGFLDQPLAVQLAFPIFEDEVHVLTTARAGS